MREEVITKEKLADDLKAIAHDGEVLFRETAGQIGEKAKDARDRLKRGIEVAKEHLTEIQQQSIKQAKIAAKATDEFVHEHPWQSVGIAFGVGALIGILIGRR